MASSACGSHDDTKPNIMAEGLVGLEKLKISCPMQQMDRSNGGAVASAVIVGSRQEQLLRAEM